MLCHGHQPLAGEVANFVPGVHEGTKHLLDDQGFLYCVSNVARTRATMRNEGDVGRFRWQCVNQNCNAAAFTELRAGDGEAERLVELRLEHNHLPDPGKVGT